MAVRVRDDDSRNFGSLTEALLSREFPCSRDAEIVDLDGLKELLAYSRSDRPEWVVTARGKRLIADENFNRNGRCA